MRRTITVPVCLVVVCVTALTAWWLYLNRSVQGDGPAPEANRSSDQANNKPRTPTEKPATVPYVYELPVDMVFFGDEQFSPRYVDLPRKDLYRWEGLVLRNDHLPGAYSRPYSRLRLLYAKDFAEIVTVRPLVKY